jgi:hypothetical protein
VGGVSESFGFLHQDRGGPALGFKVLGFSTFDPEGPEVAEIWSGPRFDAPVLGLRGVVAGEIILAAMALFGDNASVNRRRSNLRLDHKKRASPALRRYFGSNRDGGLLLHSRQPSSLG